MQNAAQSDPASVPMALGLIRQGAWKQASQMLAALARAGDVRAMEISGKMALRDQRTEDALNWCRMALHAGETAGRLTDMGVALVISGARDQARDYYQRAIAADPDAPAAYCHLGRLLYSDGARDAAVPLLQKAVACDGQYTPGQLYLGEVLFGTGDFPGAKTALEQALAQNDKNPHAWTMLARVQQALDEDDQAIESCRQALKLQPDDPMALSVLGTLWFEKGDTRQALECFQHFLAHQPASGEGHNNCGLVYLKLSRWDEAIAHFRKALAGPHPFYPAVINLGATLHLSGQPEGALRVFHKACETSPDDPRCFDGLADVELSLGHLDQAYKAFLQAIKVAPQSPSPYRQLLAMGRDWPLPPSETERLKALESQAAEMTDIDCAELHFALYQVAVREVDDTGAMRHLLAANAARRQTVRYDAAEEWLLTERLIEHTPAELFREGCTVGDDTPLPVFIVGMPRSGTSLLEQALASHPAVLGVGEISDFASVLGCEKYHDLPQTDLSELSAEDAGYLARRYLKALKGHVGKTEGVQRIVNKQPWNFRLIGYIRRLLPGAQILHIHRNPMDTCFSCLEQNFSGNLDFSYDQAELGAYYQDYARMMAHWHAVLPPEAFLDVEYETLVEDFESEMRRILAFCGLEWNPACLNFWQTKRFVLTASAAQVRRPLYLSSLGRWKRYRAALAPLEAALARPEQLLTDPGHGFA